MNARSVSLPTRFDARPVEARWYKVWLERGVFHAAVDDPRPPYSIVIPPPNVTGSLHLGHALNNTLQDTLVRHKRLQGHNVLWLPGTDHAGIATQVVVERELERQGRTRHDLGREAFVAEVWRWKEKHGARIVEQLRELGCSCDWSRERFTMGEGLSRAVREAFVRLYRDGLIYRGERLVNWCPRCQTVLSDLESPYRRVDGRLYAIRYPLAEGEGAIEIVTTRPETLLGDTAVAVHPDDERYRDLVGRRVRLPLAGREIPIVADLFVDREFGSGAVKVTPAHDPNDFECAQRLGLPALNILRPDGVLNEVAGPYAGLSVGEARDRVVSDLEAQDLLVRVEPHPHEVPHCDRCDTRIEPLLSEQWFVRMEPLAAPAIAAVREGRIRFHPRHWERTYFHWLENIRDWAVSRQLWWGHRIPAWRCDACGGWTVATDTPERCESCGQAELTQEEDVLDTWFSSGLWPFSTLGWPGDTPELHRFYPTSALSTAFDILFFWVARMIMLGLRFTGDVPFRDVYIHPLIRDAEGKKMSKSRGNVIDPIEVMKVHGTDALRYTLVSLSAQGRDIKLGEAQLEAGRAFVTKLWNAARFALLNLEDYRPEEARAPRSLYDRWIRRRLDEAVAATQGAIDAFRFNDAATVLYRFVWGELCDWYIELAKLVLQGEDPEARSAARATLVETLSGALIALHPVMPFLTEEIFQSLPGRDGRLLVEQRYPGESPPLSAEEQAEMDAFVAVVSAVRRVRGELGLAPGAAVRVGLPEAARSLLARHEPAIRALVRAEALRFDDAEPPPTAAVEQAGEHAVRVELDDPGLLGDELQRLEKTATKLEQELNKTSKKLENPMFLERADPDEVERVRERHARLDADAASTRARIERLRQVLGSRG